MLSPTFMVSLRDEGGQGGGGDVKSVITTLLSGRGGVESVIPYPYISVSLRDGIGGGGWGDVKFAKSVIPGLPSGRGMGGGGGDVKPVIPGLLSGQGRMKEGRGWGKERILNPPFPVSLRDEGAGGGGRGQWEGRDVKSVIHGLPSGKC